MTETAATPRTTSRTTVFLHWDRHGHLVATAEFPAGYSCTLITQWRERVASNGGLTVEAGTPQRTEETTRTCPGWREECRNDTEQGMDLCPDCHMGRLDAQSPRIPL